MSRSASRLAAIGLVLAAASPAAAQSPPVDTTPIQIYGPALPLNVAPLPLDLPVSSLDNTVSFHNIGVVLQADVLFAFNSAKLSGASRSRIAQAAANIRRRQPHALRIQGYTDSVGGVAYNLGLSRRRAAAVERALQRALGATAPPMQAIGYGEADPVAANTDPSGGDNPRGRALNRRVEIHYVG